MYSVLAEIPLEHYNRALAVMSVITVIFGSWLAELMIVEMARSRTHTGRDIASLTYVISTVLVFAAVALRLGLAWPREVYLAIVAVKMASVVAVTLWARSDIRRSRPRS